jgi:hypothetical protein
MSYYKLDFSLTSFYRLILMMATILLIGQLFSVT